MSYIIYNTLIVLAFPFIVGFFILKNLRGINFDLLKSIPERFGVAIFLKRLPSGRERVWVHCSSLGEAKMSVALIDRLREFAPDKLFLMSVMTQTAYDWINKNKRVDGLFYLPFDLPLLMGLFVKKIKPEILLIIETELWPNLIRKAHEAGSVVGLVNARISGGNFRFLERTGSFIGKVTGYFDFILARTEKDAYRLIALGARSERLVIAGNIKYDMLDVGDKFDKPSSVYDEFGFNKSDKIITVGSIREGEEETIISAYDKLKRMISGLKMVVAPRHLERIAFLERMLKKNNIKYNTKSGLKTSSTVGDCILLDTYGELTKAYAVSSVCIIGGSMINYGGQNLIEPALLGKAIICGPFMSNFEDAYELLRAHGALIVVNNETELVSAVKKFFEDEGSAKRIGENAMKVINTRRGALSRDLDIIKKHMSS